jgi:hypothetical protein
MRKLQSIWTVGMLAFALGGAWAQDSSTPPPTEPAPQTTPQEPAPAYGQENAPPAVQENPPLSGMDLPSLEPHAAPLSYLQRLLASRQTRTWATNWVAHRSLPFLVRWAAWS